MTREGREEFIVLIVAALILGVIALIIVSLA